MPFDFLKRKRDDVTVTVTPAVAPSVPGRGTVFDGYTDEWRLVGEMAVEGRLSDALNRRDPITISRVRWAAIDGSTPLSDAPGLQSVDPYDLIIVMAGDGSLPEMTDDERSAHRIHKVHYELALEAPPFRIIGTVQLFPGSDPSRLLDRSSDMFVPVVGARAMLGDLVLDLGTAQDILVNRFYLRGVEQVDQSTGVRGEPLPGMIRGDVR